MESSPCLPPLASDLQMRGRLSSLGMEQIQMPARSVWRQIWIARHRVREMEDEHSRLGVMLFVAKTGVWLQIKLR